MSTAGFQILALACDQRILNFVREKTLAGTLKIISDPKEWEEMINSDSDSAPDLVVCGSGSLGFPLVEVAQTLRALYPATPLIYCELDAQKMQVKTLLKNGFNETFLLPTDAHLFAEQISLAEKKKTGSGRTTYRGVTLVDLEPGDPIDFCVSIFLPINNKYVKVLKKGEDISREKFDRLNNFQVSKVYVNSEDMKEFYRYSSEKLKNLTKEDSRYSETERKERLQKAVRSIVLNLFDSSEETSLDNGKELMSDATEIVKGMVGLDTAVGVHSQLQELLNAPPEDSSRAVRVATFAALFDLMADTKKTHLAAIAGLFIDVGTSTFTEELNKKTWKDMTEEERKLYATHPAVSLRLLQSKKMVIQPELQNAILNHHERLDGSGYPNKVSGTKISELTQIVALADRFEQLAFEEGQKNSKSLEEIFSVLSKENICNLDLLRKITASVGKNNLAA